MLDCKEFMVLLETWASVTQLTHMHVERLFALMKHALGFCMHKRPDIERFDQLWSFEPMVDGTLETQWQ